jgi:hypothetical protein
MSSLKLTYCGEQHLVGLDQDFSFGRSGDLSVDDNPDLHRVLGVCFHQRGLWWLTNVGAQIPMHLEGETGTTVISLSPGGSLPLALGDTSVRFSAGGTAYEVQLEVGRHNDFEFLPLNIDQLLLLIALAEPRLRRGVTAALPNAEELMGRFGWSTARLGRKLDDLLIRFHLTMSPSDGSQPDHRSLVDFAITSGLVTADQLSLLPAREGKIRARSD